MSAALYQELDAASARAFRLEQENAKLRTEVTQAQAVCDSYATENQQFHDEIDRMRAENERLQSLVEDGVSRLITERNKLRAALEEIAKAEGGWGPFARAALEETK